MEYVYIALNKNSDSYRIGWTNDLDKRFRSPDKSRTPLNMVHIKEVPEGIGQEYHSRMYGHLWEYTKNNIPLFYTNLETILKKFEDNDWYFENMYK